MNSCNCPARRYRTTVKHTQFNACVSEARSRVSVTLMNQQCTELSDIHAAYSSLSALGQDCTVSLSSTPLTLAPGIVLLQTCTMRGNAAPQPRQGNCNTSQCHSTTHNTCMHSANLLDATATSPIREALLVDSKPGIAKSSSLLHPASLRLQAVKVQEVRCRCHRRL
jgi:hypothetical protein